MSLQTLTDFFLWCAILNFCLLLFSFIVCSTARDLIYRIHSTFFPMERETFNVAIYSLLGIYKIGVFGFTVIPYVALRIITA